MKHTHVSSVCSSELASARICTRESSHLHSRVLVLALASTRTCACEYSHLRSRVLTLALASSRTSAREYSQSLAIELVRARSFVPLSLRVHAISCSQTCCGFLEYLQWLTCVDHYMYVISTAVLNVVCEQNNASIC